MSSETLPSDLPLGLSSNSSNNFKVDRATSLSNIEDNERTPLISKNVVALADAIFNIQSPDDLQIHSLAAQLRSITVESDFK